MAALSDQLLVVAIMGYLAAMLLSAAAYAFGARGAVARAAARPARERQLVGAAVGGGEGTVRAPDSPEAEPGRGTAQRPGAAWLGRSTVGVFALAALAHLAAAVARGLAAGRMPWGNMYEYVLSVTLIGALAWLGVAVRRPALRHLGLYVALALALLLGLTGMVLYVEVSPLVPALNSYWFVIHVSAAVLASGTLLVGFVPAALFLMRAGYEKGRRRFPYSLARRLPAADTLEALAFRLHAFAFPIWTFAIAAGAIWAEAAWGRYWGWDPKETWSFISWVIYAGYLHARLTPSVKRNVAAWIAVIGWLTMMMNLFGVNIFFEGLHSYAGV
ncbi:MAG: c-type cytochrome biogenesis protein CcsB [Micromonosporaceae bacterium]